MFSKAVNLTHQLQIPLQIGNNHAAFAHLSHFNISILLYSLARTT